MVEQRKEMLEEERKRLCQNYQHKNERLRAKLQQQKEEAENRKELFRLK